MEVFKSAFLNRIAKSFAFKYTKLGAAHYPYNIEPIQLACLIEQIERTRDLTGNIAEIGVARGMTTRFLVEHLRLQKLDSTLRYYAIDTFDSFTKPDVDHEVKQRGKQPNQFYEYNYFDYEAWKRHFVEFGFVEAIKSDCTQVDYLKLSPFKLVFLDVDLYLPTKKTLELIYDLMVTGGAIVVDDVQEGNKYDGAYQALIEFVAERGLTPQFVGNKGALLIKMGAAKDFRGV